MHVLLIAQIHAERQRQDAQWGGPAHDDQHEPRDWFNYINQQQDKLGKDLLEFALKRIEGGARAPTVADNLHMGQLVRARLVKIAALAVAAIEQIDRTAERAVAKQQQPAAQQQPA